MSYKQNLDGTEIINFTSTTDNQNSGYTTVNDMVKIKPYKSYVALLTQTGANAPVATALENDLYNPVTITRLFAGSYTIDCIDFIVGKVHISGATDWNGSGSTVIPLWDESQIIGYLEIYCNQSSGKIGFEVFNAAFTRIDWSVLMGVSNLNFPEIKVYP